MMVANRIHRRIYLCAKGWDRQDGRKPKPDTNGLSHVALLGIPTRRLAHRSSQSGWPPIQPLLQSSMFVLS
uniref:hypothetical protein n=1 Tax=Roseiarcus sp. TaxID=1969460 RepID=UPI003F998269